MMTVTEDDIDYYELKAVPQMIYRGHWLDDLTNLLGQLSSSGQRVTRSRLIAMETGGTKVFIAIAQGHVVGVVLLCRMEKLTGTVDWIEDVVVDEAYRGRRIASELMDMAEKSSRSTGAKSLNLTSNPKRGVARDMYVARGYQLRDTGIFRLTF